VSNTYYLDAALYDLVYADMVADIAPHVAAAKAAGGAVLEVCCGNGRLLIPALEAGVDCDGLDSSRSMLDDLRDKLAARGLRANVVEADMRTFTLPRRYALIVIPFNSFLHNLTQEDQVATLVRCRDHLAPGGRLQLMVFHPSAQKLVEWSDVERLTKELPNPAGGRVRVHDRASDDRVEQIRHMTRRVELLDEAGRVTDEHVLRFDLRYVFKPEMELLLRVAGFARWSADVPFASYQDTAPVAPARPPREGDYLLWTAWKD